MIHLPVRVEYNYMYCRNRTGDMIRAQRTNLNNMLAKIGQGSVGVVGCDSSTMVQATGKPHSYLPLNVLVNRNLFVSQLQLSLFSVSRAKMQRKKDISSEEESHICYL